MSSWDTKVTSWLSQVPSSQDSMAAPITTNQQTSKLSWPHGVLSGGALIDILESLSTTTSLADSTYTLWLQTHYVEPFGRVDRLDGLVVQHQRDTRILKMAYERYVEFLGCGSLARKQKLWVPGLEPAYESFSPVELPQGTRRFYQQPWRSVEASYKDGKEVQKKGVYLGRWKDEAKWERAIWTQKVPLEDEAKPPPEIS